jgi:pyruvate oxidase
MVASDLVVKILVQMGVRRVYGIPGDAINDLMESIRKADDISFIQVKHEEAGALAASIEAKLSGQLAVCVGTSGPGAIHLLNGLYDAKLDHAPVLAITGQVETPFIGTNYHQEVDLERLFSDVAEYSQTITSEQQLPEIVLEACRAAILNNAVAHISLPSDIAGRKVKVSSDNIASIPKRGEAVPSERDINTACELLTGANKVALLVGIGAANGVAQLMDFASMLQAPVVRTLRAKDIIDEGNPFHVGGIGLLGTKPGVDAIDECDLLICVGTDFPYTEFYPDDAKVIQIDNVATQIGKRVAVDVGLIGEVESTLPVLMEELSSRGFSAGSEQIAFLSKIQSAYKGWGEKQHKKEEDDSFPIKPQALFHKISELSKPDSIFIIDTGTSNAWSARHLKVGPNQRFTLSSALGTMGVAVPGAIGAQLAYPDRPVVAIVGDGAFSMMMADLMTAVRSKLPITVIIVNNGELGFIALEQQAKGLPPFGIDVHNPDFVAYARSVGAEGFKVESAEDLATSLEQATNSVRPYVIDVQVDNSELIIPPKIEVDAALGFVKAKVRQWFDQQ